MGLVHAKHYQKIDKGQKRLVKGQKRPLLKIVKLAQSILVPRVSTLRASPR